MAIDSIVDAFSIDTSIGIARVIDDLLITEVSFPAFPTIALEASSFLVDTIAIDAWTDLWVRMLSALLFNAFLNLLRFK